MAREPDLTRAPEQDTQSGSHSPVPETLPDQHEDQANITQEVLIEWASRRHAGAAKYHVSGLESMKMTFPARPAPKMAASTGIVLIIELSNVIFSCE